MMKKVSPSLLDRPGLRHTSISQLTTTATEGHFETIWASPKVFLALLRWKSLLSKRSCQNNRLCPWVSSSSAQRLLAWLNQRICWSLAALAPKWIRTHPHITSAAQNVGAETSLINLARSSPSIHIFPVLCFWSEHKQDSLAYTDPFRLALFISLSRLYRVI